VYEFHKTTTQPASILNTLKLGKHYPCPRAVSMGLEYRCQITTPVFTGRVDHQRIQHGRERQCHFLTPMFMAHGHGHHFGHACSWTCEHG